MSPAAAPCSASARRAPRASRRSASARAAARPVGVQRPPEPRRPHRRASAPGRCPRPRARWRSAGESTSPMPSASATWQATWPAAPPNATSAWSRGSKPRSVEMRRIAPAICSTATARNPSAAASTLGRAHRRRQFGRAGRAPPPDVERRVAVRAEHRRERRRVEPAQHQVGVGDRRRPAAAVAGAGRDRRRRWPGRPGRAGRRSAGSSRRRPPPSPRPASALRTFTPATVRGVAPLQRAGVAADVGRGAAHVEAEHGCAAAASAAPATPDHAARRAGDQRVAAAERARPAPARRPRS